MNLHREAESPRRQRLGQRAQGGRRVIAGMRAAVAVPAVLALAGALAALPAVAVVAAEPLPEYDVKVAFLYNFALFTDWPGALDAGVMIVMALDERRVVFEVNREAAAGAGLSLSSKLLRLARAVR